MAQQDTGLGWSAESEYLISSGPALLGNLSKYYAEGYSNQPLAYCPADTDVHTIGTRIGLVQGQEYFIGSNTENAIIFIASSGNYQYALSTIQNFSIRLAVRRNGSWVGHSVENKNGSYDSTTGLYYSRLALDTSHTWTYDASIFPYTSRGTVIKSANDPYYKLNPGYAVAGLVSWLSLAGDTLTTPVLISSDKDAVKLSADGTTEIAEQMIADQLYDGIHFYMSFLNLRDYSFTNENVPIIDLTQFGASQPTKVFKLIIDPSIANVQVSNSPDPYQEGDGSEEGGADGEEDTADNVDFTDPPSTSIGATGLLTIFCPDLYQLQSLGNYMWSTFDVDNWRKIIANPMDAILGLHTIPIPAVITGTKAVKVAGIDTTIDMSYTTVRYIRRSMGTCEIPKKWGAYLDYSPYTKISIFLPFIGFKELDADDIMGKTIALQYMFDILTGACVAELKCGDTVLYTWSGNCANEVPISGSDWRGAIASAIGIAATVAGTALVTGGATAPMAASMVASVGANSMNLKPTINRSGAIAGSAGYMGQKRPYIIRSIPNLVIPADQNKFMGYPSFVTTSLGSLTGYNEISSIHLEGIPATGNELAEIETLLKDGVIF